MWLATCFVDRAGSQGEVLLKDYLQYSLLIVKILWQPFIMGATQLASEANCVAPSWPWKPSANAEKARLQDLTFYELASDPTYGYPNAGLSTLTH